MTFYKETNFKEEALVGEIPKDWQAVRLGDLGALQYGITASAKNEETGIRFLRITDIKNSGTIDWSSVPYCELSDAEMERYQLQMGNVLFARIGATTGKTCYVDRPIKSVFGSYLIRFQPTKEKEIDTMFLYYYTQSKIYWSQVNRVKEGQLKKGLNTELLRHLMLPRPSYSEQRKIVEVLSVFDLAIGKAGEVIAKTERLKKGLMQELLTKGIGHTEYKDTPIGKTPKTWQTVELGEIIDIMSGQYFKFSEFSEEGVRCLKIDNVGFGKVVWETSTVLPDDYTKQYPELVLNDGDIVLALNRPIIDNKVKVGILKKEDSPSILYQRVGKIIIKDTSKVDRQFLFCTFTGEYFRQQLSHSLIGTDQPYIRTPILLRIKIPLPPVPEQQRIAKILYEVDKKLELERREKASLERVKRGLMDLLLTGKVRVKVD